MARHHKILHHGSLTLLLFGLISLLSGFGLALQGWLGQANANSGVFAGTNPWNVRLPKTTPTFGSPTISASVSTDGPTFYTAASNAPTVTVTEWDCDGDGLTPGLASQWQNVPLPTVPLTGASGRLLVFQASSQTLWEFSQLRQTGLNWEACSGGRIQATSTGIGTYSSPFGLTGSGISYAAGEILTSDVRAGLIDHAIGLSLSNVSGSVSWPAGRSNGSGGSLVMGQRLRIDPTVNIDSLGLSSFAKMVAKAAQNYGFIIWDSGTNSITAESPTASIANGQGNPYIGLDTSLAGFPWDKLIALPVNYGQGGIQPQITSFNQSATTIAPGGTVTLSWQANNVDQCSIPPNAANLPTSGSWQSPVLNSDIGFSLVCAGPAGPTSHAAAVHIDQAFHAPTPPTIADGETLALTPVSGLVAVLPGLDSQLAAETVQKVEYFERGLLIYSTTTPPFNLDTRKLPNGPHVLDMTISYRDGHKEQQRRTITVANESDTLTIAPIQKISRLPTILSTTGGVATLFAVMGLAIRRGLLLAHLD